METRTTLFQVVRNGNISRKVRVELRDGVLCVPWSNIRQVFTHADNVNDADGITIPFMRDGNDNTIEPPRLEYQEGCVWDVDSVHSSTSLTELTSTQQPLIRRGTNFEHSLPIRPVEHPNDSPRSESDSTLYAETSSHWRFSHTQDYGGMIIPTQNDGNGYTLIQNNGNGSTPTQNSGNGSTPTQNNGPSQAQPASSLPGPQTYPDSPISLFIPATTQPGAPQTIPIFPPTQVGHIPNGLTTTEDYIPPPPPLITGPIPFPSPMDGRARNLTVYTHAPHTTPRNSEFYDLPSPVSARTESDRQITRTIMTSEIARVKSFHTQTLEVLTRNMAFFEQTSPRLFVVLRDRPTAANRFQESGSPFEEGQVKFRLYFLCECGHHTRPLNDTSLNQVHLMDQHFMDQHGYEITRPNEFFRKYGAFTRYFSDIIKSGISYNTTKIENLVELNMRLQSRQSRFSPNSRDWKNLEYEVNARAILDMELGDMIEHLNLLEDNGSFLGFHALDGTDIRPLLEYVNIPKDHLGSPAPLYHICTEEGFGKWICKDHYQQTIFGKAVDGFLINAQKLGWRNSRRVGKAKITFKNQWDADVFYKCVKGLESLFEMDIGLGWVVSASDLWSLKIALSTSKVAVLSLDVHGLVPGAESPQNPRIEFPRLQSLKLSKMPLNAFVKPSDSYPNLKALHLDNVGPDSSTVGLLTMFSAMVELSIPGRMIGDHGLGILYRSPNTNLRVIDLSRNGITDRGGNMLATILSKSKGVSSINLSHNDLGDTVVAKIIRQLGPRLLSLSLASVGFGLESARMLKNMIGDNFILSNPGARLNCLDLSKSSWGLDMLLILIDIIIAMYDGEAFAPETLDIAATFLMVNLMAQPTNAGHCHAILTENYERPQECLANSSRIRSLQLRDSTVPEDAAEKLVDMLDMSSVTRLELYQLGKVIQPRNVDLTLNRVFANSPGTILNRLSYLDMHQTEARDSAADILAHQLTLGDCQLEYLNLSSNRITSKGVNAILHALCYNRSVITLYMGSQASSDSTPFIPEPQIQLADFLGNNKTVRRIYIPSATITELTAGLASNENIQVLLLDQWEGTYDNAGELGTALRENRGLVQFRIFGERKANASPRSSRDGSKSEMAGFFIRNVASNNRLQILEWPDFLNGVEATDGPSGGGGGASLRRDLSVHSTTSSRSAGSSNSIKSFISSHTSIQTSLLKSPQSIDVPNSQSRTSEESVVSAMGSNPGMVSKSSGKGKQKISGLLNGLLGSGLAAPEPIQGKATVRAEVIAKLPRGAPQRR